MDSPDSPPESPVERFKAALAAGALRVQAETTKSPEDAAQERQLDSERKFQDVRKVILANENEAALIGLRKVYGFGMIAFLWIYFLAAFALIWATAARHLSVPEGVQAALVGGTAVAVIGVVGTIIAGLFRVPKD